MLLFKVLGFLATVTSTYSFGFLKSKALKLRLEKIHNIQKNITSLKEKIRVNAGEIPFLLSSSFGEFPISYRYLEKDDIKLLEEFFDNIGMSDSKSEYERCELYFNLLTPKLQEAEQNYRELGKLYRNIGLFSGIFICIILL